MLLHINVSNNVCGMNNINWWIVGGCRILFFSRCSCTFIHSFIDALAGNSPITCNQKIMVEWYRYELIVKLFIINSIHFLNNNFHNISLPANDNVSFVEISVYYLHRSLDNMEGN